MARRQLLLPLALLTSLLLAGCSLRNTTDPEGSEPGERMESAACGFRIDLPKGWTRVGSAAVGGYTFGPPPAMGSNESIVLLVMPQPMLEEARATLSEGRASAAASGFLDEGRIVDWGNDTLDGHPAVSLRVEGVRGNAQLAWESRLADVGNRSLVLSWSVDLGREPTPTLRAALASLNVTGTPTPECGYPPEAPPLPVEDDGWVRYAQPQGQWTMRHPANWTVTDLSEEGVAILLSGPLEGANDTYLDSVLVVLRTGASGMHLDGLAEAALEQLTERVPAFEPIHVGNATLGNEPARFIYSREEHRGHQVEGMRFLALRGDTLYWIEALVLYEGGATFITDLEKAIESFRIEAPA